MLSIALWLAAAPMYDDASFRDDDEHSAPVPEVAPAPAPERTPKRRRAVREAPPAHEKFTPHQQWGFTGSLGATVPVTGNGGVGVQGGVGVRYGMRPPPYDWVYFTPAISLRLTGGYTTADWAEPQPSQPLTPREPVATESGNVGADVRLELTVSRRGGMLLPDFATWLSTGSAVVIDQRGFAGVATHVGFGLGIDFVRDVSPALARSLFSPDAFAGVIDFTFGAAGAFARTGYGIIAALFAVVVIPVVCVAGMGVVFLSGTAVSAAQLEVRYTVLASQRGLDGNAGLVLGIGI